MRQDNLTHTLHIRVSPTLRDELAAEAERNDETVGALVRRAVRAELGDAEARRLDPWVNLPHGEAEEILIRVLQTRGNSEELQQVICDIGDHIVDILDVGFATLDALHSEGGDHSLRRASGFLQQGSESLLRAAYGIRALRAQGLLAGGELERIEARIASGEAA